MSDYVTYSDSGTGSWGGGSVSSDYNSTDWPYDAAGHPMGTSGYSGTPDHVYSAHTIPEAHAKVAEAVATMHAEHAAVAKPAAHSEGYISRAVSWFTSEPKDEFAELDGNHACASTGASASSTTASARSTAKYATTPAAGTGKPRAMVVKLIFAALLALVIYGCYHHEKIWDSTLIKSGMAVYLDKKSAVVNHHKKRDVW